MGSTEATDALFGPFGDKKATRMALDAIASSKYAAGLDFALAQLDDPELRLGALTVLTALEDPRGIAPVMANGALYNWGTKRTALGSLEAMGWEAQTPREVLFANIARGDER